MLLAYDKDTQDSFQAIQYMLDDYRYNESALNIPCKDIKAYSPSFSKDSDLCVIEFGLSCRVSYETFRIFLSLAY